MGDQNLLFRAPPCFGRHVKLLVLTAFAVVCAHSCSSSRRVDGWWPAVKIVAVSLPQHVEKHVVPTPLSGIRVGKKRLCFTQNNKHTKENINSVKGGFIAIKQYFPRPPDVKGDN
jgi:hypothetical protein